MADANIPASTGDELPVVDSVYPEEAAAQQTIIPTAAQMYSQVPQMASVAQLPEPPPIPYRIPAALESAATGIGQIFTGTPTEDRQIKVPAKPVDLGAMANVVPPVATPAQPVTQPVAAPIPAEAAITSPVPTAEEVLSTANKINTGLRATNTQNAAAAEAEKEALDAEKVNNERMAETQRRIDELDKQVRTKSLPEIMQSGSFGQKVGAAIAIGLGAISQGLSGAKENPVIDFLNKTAEQQAVRDKLTQDQKDSLRKMLLEQGQLQIQRMEAATNNRYRKEMLALERDKLAQAQAEIGAAQQAAALAQQQATDMWSGRPLSDAEYASLKSEDKDKVINLIDGRRVLASSASNARDWSTKSQEVYNALDSVKQLKDMAAGGWSLQKYMAAKPLIQKLVGGLRLPYTGPGVLTDTERAQLIAAIGNPMNIFAFKSLELAKLNQVEHDLNANLQNTAKINGIRAKLVPETFYLTRTKSGEVVKRTEDQLLNMWKQKNPNSTKESALAFIRKTYKPAD